MFYKTIALYLKLGTGYAKLIFVLKRNDSIYSHPTYNYFRAIKACVATVPIFKDQVNP